MAIKTSLCLAIAAFMSIDCVTQTQSADLSPPVTWEDLAAIETAGGEPGKGFAGAYLSSHFAQGQNDWDTASSLLDQIIARDPENAELIRQAMIISAGAGLHEQADRWAKALIRHDSRDTMAYLIIGAHAIGQKDYAAAIKALESMPGGDLPDFIRPLMMAWAEAGQGEYEPSRLSGTTIHAYHGGLIAHYMKQPNDKIFSFAEMILSPSGLTAEEVERAADLMAISGRKQDSLNIYKALQSQKGGSDALQKKIESVDKGLDLSELIPALRITSANQGAAIALYDLARMLHSEESDASARIFAQMSLDMNPDAVEPHLLLALSYARTDQLDEAIRQYAAIPEGHKSYLSAQHRAAELLHETGKEEEAIALLNTLYKTHGDPDSLIRIGDLYREDEDYKEALDIYESTAKIIGEPLGEEYWHLLYARGMTLERLGEWERAEADLKAALEFQPDHPYILNYLGYGWADQGIRLDEAIKMLNKASSLMPDDGYIADSLGWVKYRLGQYQDSVPHLERAVELRPYDAVINDHLGDAYWRVGRKLEARFQWERAKNYSEDPLLNDTINGKIAKGLADPKPDTGIKSAQGSRNVSSEN